MRICLIFLVDDKSENDIDMIKEEVGAAEHVYSFTNIIRKCHTDQNGHVMVFHCLHKVIVFTLITLFESVT